MTDEQELDSVVAVDTPGDDRHDPFFTAFLVGIVALLLLCVVVILIANSRPPAGL